MPSSKICRAGPRVRAAALSLTLAAPTAKKVLNALVPAGTFAGFGRWDTQVANEV